MASDAGSRVDGWVDLLYLLYVFMCEVVRHASRHGGPWLERHRTPDHVRAGSGRLHTVQYRSVVASGSRAGKRGDKVRRRARAQGRAGP